MLQNPLDVINKAHAQHFVGFVQNNGLEVIEFQTATTQVIHHTTRSTYHNLRTTVQTAQLTAHILTTIDWQNVEVRHVFGVALARFGHLNSQFTGRAQHQNLSVVLAGIDTGQRRQSKRGRLTGTSLSQTEEVPPFQQMGNTTSLNG